VPVRPTIPDMRQQCSGVRTRQISFIRDHNVSLILQSAVRSHHSTICNYTSGNTHVIPNVYIPENRQGFAHTLLVCATLYIVKQYTDNPLLLQDPNHPRWNFFTQGNPGTGKTFVIMMILNCVRALRGCVMECAASVAPAGCTASLFNGRTSHRFFNFPIGNKINKQVA
jgi:Cdc6-like AAA superfamily ATPase